jgi:cell division protein FtsI/penicillin-binding protein 2
MEKTRKITRSDLILGGVFLVFLIFAAQLVKLQIVQHEDYLAKAKAMQKSSRVLKAMRGEIYARDADGSVAPLVLNETVYEVAADPHILYDGDELDMTKFNDLKNILQTVAADNVRAGAFDDGFSESSRYVLLAKQVTRTQALQIKAAVTEKDIPGVTLSPGSRRVYVEDTMAAQTLGFVNVDGDGQYGVEQYLDKELRGEDGLLESVRDARNTPLPIGIDEIDVPAQDGDNVVLTIDRNVQNQVEESLKNGLASIGATKGSVVVLNPENGEVMAMANYPTYNPAKYYEVQDAEVFQNKIVSYAYEPGSVIKSLAMGAALDTGAVKPEDTYYNTGCVDVDDAHICNASRQVDERTMDMTQVLGWSLNTGMVWVLQQMGGGDITLAARQTLYNYYTDHFLLGKTTGIEQVGEAAGSIILPDTIDGARVVYSNMVFGQGMNVTNLQVAASFAAAINGGDYYKPHLLAGTYNDKNFVPYQKSEPSLRNVLQPETSQTLKEMLHEARKTYTINLGNDQGFYVGGKTGTAQIYDENTHTYSETMTVGTYVGYGADANKTPKYVIMVRVDPEGGKQLGGQYDAMPIFNEISNYMLRYLGVSKP